MLHQTMHQWVAWKIKAIFLSIMKSSRLTNTGMFVSCVSADVERKNYLFSHGLRFPTFGVDNSSRGGNIKTVHFSTNLQKCVYDVSNQ